MSLPFQPLSLTFKDVWYSVTMPPGVGQDVIERAKVSCHADGNNLLVTCHAAGHVRSLPSLDMYVAL